MVRWLSVCVLVALSLNASGVALGADGDVRTEYRDIDTSVSPTLYQRRVDVWHSLDAAGVASAHGAGATLVMRMKTAKYVAFGLLDWSNPWKSTMNLSPVVNPMTGYMGFWFMPSPSAWTMDAGIPYPPKVRYQMGVKDASGLITWSGSYNDI